METKVVIAYCAYWFFIYTFVGLLELLSAEDILVNTVQGTVRGSKDTVTAYLLTNDKIRGRPFYKFLGIPFAQPPVGPLRFKAPQPLQPWTGVRDALKTGASCVQVGVSVTGEEDCLYINVYTPQLPNAEEPLKPVMFWIYGGSFQSGNGGTNVYGPDYLVAKDVVVVTFNYRLNVLGFLSLENNNVSGNYGLKDQVQALRWVQENIAQFGGDPGRVTVFGESAGGASVHYQLLTPLTKGLFQYAIVQSGSALSYWAFTKTPKENAVKLAQFMGKNIEDENELYDFYMSQPASALVKACSSLRTKEESNMLNTSSYTLFVPSVEVLSTEDSFITQSPVEIMLKGEFNKVPLMIGTLDAEGIVALVVVKLTEKAFKILNNDSDWAVPINWGVKSEAERNRIGLEVKKYLFNEEKISWKTINDLVKFYTDTLFLMDIDNTITAFLNYSKAPVYNYRMTFQPSRSPIKTEAKFKQGRNMDLKGAAHADDVPLIFRPYILEAVPFPAKDQTVSHKMTDMWTSFAKTGNPNCPGLDVTWSKLGKDNRSYLEIDSELSIKGGRIDQSRLQFWDQLCRSSSMDYICFVLS